MPTKRRKLTKYQQQYIDKMKAGYPLIREGDRFYLAEREITKKAVINLLKRRAIRPSRDGLSFGRSQTYQVAAQ